MSIKAQTLDFFNSGMLTVISFFVLRFFGRIDKTEKKVEELDNRVLKIETVDQTRKEMKKELKAGNYAD